MTTVTMAATNTSTSPVPEVAPPGLSVEGHIWVYTAPVILLLGAVGNVLTIAVKAARSARGSSTPVYFVGLAAGDLAVLVVGLVPEWLGQMGLVELWELSPWVCRVELYLYYTALDFAIWMLVAFTCDRAIAVRFPLHKRRICTARNAGIVSLAIFLVANLNAHVFWTRGAQYDDNGELIGNCRWLGRYFYFESTVRPWLVLAGALVGPFIVIGACNVAILSTVRSAQSARKLSAVGSLARRSTARRMDRQLSQTTIMCMFASVAFMLLVLPNIVLLIGKDAWSRDNPTYAHARAVAGQLVYINHSVNFLLYSLTGSHFRRELSALCRRTKSARRDTDFSFTAPSKTTRSTSVTSQQHVTTSVTSQQHVRLNVSLVQDPKDYANQGPYARSRHANGPGTDSRVRGYSQESSTQ